MEGVRGRYLPPIKLFLTLGSLYTLLLFLAQPAMTGLSRQISEMARRPETAKLIQRLSDRGVSTELADERYQSRTIAVVPATTALSLLPLVPILRRMNRRRSWHQHLLFLFALSNIFWVYGLLLLPLAALSFKAFTIVLLVILEAVFAVVYWRLYRGRSAARTILAFVTVALVNLVTGVILVLLASVLVFASLFFF
jgi:hypothetical protein